MVPGTGLVGRERELAELVSGLDAAGAGRGGVYLLVGEPGIGKSRLTEEAARAAAQRGQRVVWGRCWEGAGAPPFWPWIQVLRALAREGEPLGELAAILPEAGAQAAPTDRFEMFDALARVLAGAAARQPLVVALEDLHAADRASLAALSFVVKQASSASLLILGTYRDVEARLSAEADELLQRAARAARIVPLRRLTREDVAALVGRDDETTAAVHRATEGNPLFVHEVLRVLGSLGPDAHGRFPIPDGVRAAIREHVRLAGAAREPLEVAAVLGRDFSLPALAASLGREATAVAEALAPALKAGLIVEVAPRQYRFSHVLIRETLDEDLPATRRAELHRRIADALIALHDADPAAPWAEIAHHCFEAGPASVGDAIEYARRAAERAVRQLAFEEASATLERALVALEAAAPGDAHRRAELLIELGRARILGGDTERGLEAASAASELARSLRSPELLARAALTHGLVFTFAVPSTILIGLLEEALQALGTAETPLRARALARLAGAVQPAASPVRPIELARESIALARRLGDPETLVYALHAGGSAVANVGELEENLALAHELVREARRIGDRAAELRGLIRAFASSLDLGDPEGADAALRDYERAVAPFRQPRHHWWLALMRSARATIEGRWEESARHVDEARRLGEAARDPNATRSIAAHEVALARLKGAIDVPISPTVASMMENVPGMLRIFRLQVATATPDEARAALAACREEWRVWGIYAARVAEVALCAGDRETLERVHGWLAPEWRRFTSWGVAGMVFEGPLSRWLFRLKAALGDWEEARRWYEDALGRARRMGMAPFVERLEREWAELRTDDRPTALALRREGDVWLVEGEGERCRVKDSRGLHMLAQLFAHPGRELHCVELGGGDGVVDAGDAGEVLDPRARAEYKARLQELRDEVEEAESWNDPARARRARDELEFLEKELARAIGLGGRDRREGSAAERARVNVQRRLKSAIDHIAKSAPALGQRLAETIRTGTFCCYEPEAPRKRT